MVRPIRPELLAELASFELRVPALAERREDIGIVVAELLGEMGMTDVRFEPLAVSMLFQYDWPGGADELRAALSYALQMRRGRMITLESLPPWLVARVPGPSQLARRHEPTPWPRMDTSVCMLVSHEGTRPIGEVEYRHIMAETCSLDLFITLVGRCRGSRRDDRGKVEAVELEASGAAALAELIERRMPLRPAELRSVTVARPLRLIERARKKIDVRRGRYDWRALRTLPGSGADGRRFFFDPPPAFRFAVLRPLT